MPPISAVFQHFTIGSHSSLIPWKSWECSPVASSHPSCQACSGLSAILLWAAKLEWNQSSRGTNCSCFIFHDVLLFLHTHVSLVTPHPTASLLFFPIPFCNCSTHSALLPQHKFFTHICVTSSDSLRYCWPMKTAPVPFPGASARQI